MVLGLKYFDPTKDLFFAGYLEFKEILCGNTFNLIIFQLQKLLGIKQMGVSEAWFRVDITKSLKIDQIKPKKFKF